MKKRVLIGLLITMLGFMPASYSQQTGTVAKQGSAEGLQSPVIPNVGTMPTGQELSENKLATLTDHKASVLNLGGEVKILREGARDWTTLSKQDVIRKGDQIKTLEESFVEIAYDDSYLNIARIGSNTFAEFRAIEPTDIFLSDGSIYSSLEGLLKDSTYEVATPQAVGGIRGTEFLRLYQASTGADTTLVPEGVVETFQVLSDGLLHPEAIHVKAGQTFYFDRDMLKTKGFHEIQPVQLNEEQKKMMQVISDKIRSTLIAVIGDPQVLAKVRELWKKELADPEIAEKVNDTIDKNREYVNTQTFREFAELENRGDSPRVQNKINQFAGGVPASQSQGKGKGEGKGKGK